MRNLRTLCAALLVFFAVSLSHAVDLTGIETDIAAFLTKLNSGGGKPMEQMTPAEARKVLEGAQVGAELPPADVEEKTIEADGLSVKLFIVRPQGAKGVIPAFMFFHGGGWVLGDFPTHERFVRDLVVDSRAVAIFVEYTRSPEAQYPTALNECYAATKWVAAHGAEIHVDGKRLAVVGNSVGGNLAAAVALKAKAEGSPKLALQVLFWPVTDANFDTPSYKQFDNGYFLSRNMMIWFWDHYTKDPKQRAEIYASPLRATTEQLAGLPPALIQTAGSDVLRDEGEAYASKLNEAGVTVTAVRYTNLIHDYGLLNPISHVPAVRDALHQAAEAIKQHLY